jgi:hypothetical protein
MQRYQDLQPPYLLALKIWDKFLGTLPEFLKGLADEGMVVDLEGIIEEYQKRKWMAGIGLLCGPPPHLFYAMLSSAIPPVEI